MLFFKRRRTQLLQKKSFFRFKIHKTEKGTIGVFRDYPYVDEVIQALEICGKDFQVKNSQTNRFKKMFTIIIEGSEREFIVKGKRTNYSLNDDSYPRSVRYLQEQCTFGFEVPNFSVLHELLSNREAVRRYKNKYKKDLFIETPVGFYISALPGQKGARWVIFEYIPNILNMMSETVNSEQSYYSECILSELNMIGVYNKAFFKRDFDLVPVKNGKDIDFAIVDSEDWYIKKNI